MFAALHHERLHPHLEPYHKDVEELEQRIDKAKLNTDRIDDDVLQYDILRNEYLINQYKVTRTQKIEKYPYYLLENFKHNMSKTEIDYCEKVIQYYELYLLQLKPNFPKIQNIISSTNFHKAEPEMDSGIIFTSDHIQALKLSGEMETIDTGVSYGTNFSQLENLIEYSLQ
eukprot:NODE_213_length_12556_cov_0.937063.p10 type:complete len:171 gc:universal NODE_213_length_12556_cov_0.937063:6548-6036(-)